MAALALVGAIVLAGALLLAGWLACMLHIGRRDLVAAAEWQRIAEVYRGWLVEVADTLHQEGHAPLPDPGSTVSRICIPCQGRCRYQRPLRLVADALASPPAPAPAGWPCAVEVTATLLPTGPFPTGRAS